MTGPRRETSVRLVPVLSSRALPEAGGLGATPSLAAPAASVALSLILLPAESRVNEILGGVRQIHLGFWTGDERRTRGEGRRGGETRRSYLATS